MFNRIVLLGNLTRDPELRYTPNGKAVTTFGLACNRKYGEYEEVLFIDIEVWGKQAENASQYLGKGSQCLVDGRLKTRQWESDGQKRSKIECVAENIRYMSKKKEQGTEGITPPDDSDLEPF